MKVNKSTPDVFLDRAVLSTLPQDLKDELLRRGLHTKGENPKVSFVGVVVCKDFVSVFLPRSSGKIPVDKKLNLACKTLRAVNRYARSSETRVYGNDEGEGREGLEQLSLIFTLLEDFQRNGIYSRRLAVRKLNSGRIDWARTIKRVIPFPSVGGAPVYLDYHGIEKKYSDTCEIAAIHASVIRDLDVRFSWLLTGESNPVAIELNSYPEPRGDRVSKLRKELSITYSDRDVRLLESLIHYIEKGAGNEKSAFVSGLGDFHYCWEHMLGKVLEYNVTSDLNKKLPAPVYIDKSNIELLANDKSMRTDIILNDVVSGRCTVADAKYYAATTVQNAPGWGDIVKQLFYEKALSELDEISSEVKNVFIFPGDDGNLREVKLRDRVHSTDDNTVFLDYFKPIYCLYVNPMDVVGHYIFGKKMHLLSQTVLDVGSAAPQVEIDYM